ncbi:MAG: hypothetical protein IT323_19325 [Anaerolineae bacterium]|nr:hypothetical protein [Anaerolineae bacterium]
MLRRLNTRLMAQLPDFARPDHPALRYLLNREQRRAWGASALPGVRLALAVAIFLALCAPGWWIASAFGRTPVSTPNALDGLYQIAYWPLVGIQLLSRIFAFNATVGMVAAETRAGTWEALKVTTEGANLAFRARWAMVFYRLWPFLAVMLIARLVFVLVALGNLTAFQGHYLDLLLSGTTPLGRAPLDPALTVVLGTLIVAAMMTAALLAPFTAVAFDAALGLAISVAARGRMLSTFGQVVFILLRLMLTGWALWVGAAALDLTPFTGLTQALMPGTTALSGWLGAFAGMAEGDLGLTLLHLPYYPRLWADYDHGVFIGLACLGFVIVQAALASGLVRWASRRAAAPERG